MWLGADMAAVGELVLVLGLLVSAHCEVRARDPEVEEEEEFGGRVAPGGGGGAFPPHLTGLTPGATETPPQGEGGNYPARTGNWCAFVQKRVVTTAIACGSEEYTVKSLSPCPSGTPDCQVVMYKLSTRPVYRQKHRIITALLWRCCPGHGGDNCEDTVSGTELKSENSDQTKGPEAEKTEFHTSGVKEKLQLQRVDPDREQNDHQTSVSSLYDTGYTDNQHNATHPAQSLGTAHNPHHASHQATNSYEHYVHHQRHPQHPHHAHYGQQHQPAKDPVVAAPLQYSDTPAALPVPHMMALVMSQLQPVLEGFNHSLQHLSRQVGDLARDVAQLKNNQLGSELQAQPPDVSELDEAAEERLNTRLDETLHQISEVRRQVERQRIDMENRLHSQHAMLHYNLTSFKTDIDMKLKRHQKMLQINLQAMNNTLAELKMDQDQATEDLLEVHTPPPVLPTPHPLQPTDTSALWLAIERLDNMVVNNTVKVDGLMEDMEVTSGSVQQLRRDMKDLGKQINQTTRTSQMQFMETGLEVEAAREVVLRRVGELAGNLSLQDMRMLELDQDLELLWNDFQRHNSSVDHNCKGLKAAMAKLENGLASVTELANENKLSLEESNEGGAGQWEGSDWEPAVGALHQGLQQVTETLTSEHSRTSALEHSLSQLNSTLTVGLAEISGLKSIDKRLVEDMKRLDGSFKSLLNDAIRHSDVLELLLGEDVLEFLEWPIQDQDAHSIPALKVQLSHLQEQLREQNQSITSLLRNRPEDREEAPSADQPPSSSHPEDWPPAISSSGVPTRERQLLQPERRRPELAGDGSDLWNLEKTVEELGRKVHHLEEKVRNNSAERTAPPSGVDAKLQAEVLWLRRGLEDHLRVFKNVFSNAHVLMGRDATLQLDKLWMLVESREGKKEKKRGGKKKNGGGGGNQRSRREASGVVPAMYSQSDDPLLLVAGSPRGVSNRVILLEASLNRGQLYSDTGTFTAPVNGIYLFVLTLDLRPGPAHVVLRRGSGGAPVSLHRQEVTETGPVTGVSLLALSEGEEVRLELNGGGWKESEDNVFTTLLIHRTT